METKTPETAKSPEVVTPSSTTVTSTAIKPKRSNTLLIVVIIIIVLLVLCCGPFLAIPAALFGALPFLSFLAPAVINEGNVQNAIENIVENQTGNDVDFSLNYDKNKTSPLPTTVPQEVRSVFSAQIGDPFNVSSSISDTDSYVIAWYSTTKNFESIASTIEKDLKAAGWDITKTESTQNDERTVVLLGSKTIDGKEYAFSSAFTDNGSDADIVLTIGF